MQHALQIMCSSILCSTNPYNHTTSTSFTIGSKGLSMILMLFVLMILVKSVTLIKIMTLNAIVFVMVIVCVVGQWFFHTETVSGVHGLIPKLVPKYM